MAETGKISVLVAGAAGRMGKEVVKAAAAEKDLTIAAAVDHQCSGEDAGTVAGIAKLGVQISPFIENSVSSKKPDVMVDFTRHDAAVANIKFCLSNKVACVVGTTGIPEKDLDEIKKICEERQTPALIAPNFAIGAVLLMKFAKEASKYFSWGEIIDLHHEKKLDAPSGTAIRTAELMLESRPNFEKHSGEEKIAGSRGGEKNGIRLHSVRLPGLLAHQEVLFGGLGQTLTLRHDSLSRESFMPGVILAIRKIRGRKGLIVGLENILE